MPKKPIDYSKTIMYKLACKDPTILDSYVGSTTQHTKRKYSHKSACNNPNSKKYSYYVYDFIRQHGGWNNWDMILIEKYPCENELEKLKRERYWVEELKATLNKIQGIGLQVELGIQGYKKTKYLKSKETILNKQMDYYETNKNKILEARSKQCICECGSSYTHGHKSRHNKTLKHKQWEELQK